MLARTARNALAKRPIFRFRGCLYAQERAPVLSRAASSAAVTMPATADDIELISLFDRPRDKRPSHSFSYSGIFGHPSLTTPPAFSTLANSTLVRAQLLTERILRARESRSELFKVIKNLDRLSDMLCGVIDLAELIRNAHPDPRWIHVAEESYEKLCEYMNVLNTDVGLYEVLQVVLTDPEILRSLTPEAHQTALIFWRDFKKSAINLPPAQREKFVSLSSEILNVGRQFVNGVSSPRPPTAIKGKELVGLKDSGMGTRIRMQAQFTNRDLMIYPGSLQAHMIMRSAPSEEPRRKIYMATHSSDRDQLELLERLLHARAELARLVGWDSFADMTLGDKMSKSPENVNHFLDTLLDHTRPHARKALRALSLRKQAHLNLSELPVIQAWDRDYYCPPEAPAPPIPLPPLTLGRVFMALSRLFRHLYGISLRPAETVSGEVWHTDVLKLEVVDEDAGLIGWIYADLFSREGKSCGAAHYTVRCSRRVDDDDEASDLVVGDVESLVRASCDFDAAKRHRVRGQDGVFQLPLVVLLCEFARPTVSRGPTVLEWHDVTTLFHEMGHAMHSMIGRTEYHNVAGTRCATDFVELPSILMEHFLTSPTVLSLFDADGSLTHRRTVSQLEDPCRYIDIYSQILMSVLDQIYHSPAALDPNFDSTVALANLHSSRGLIPHVPGTSVQTQFGHLFGYGATYYSYLFDRAIASHLWSKLFSSNPLSREKGDRYKREVLGYGGGKDPWSMLSTLLEAPELDVGNVDAMREVGRWRIEDEVTVSGRH